MSTTMNETLPVAAPSTTSSAPRPALRTWHLFAAVSLVAVLLAWLNNEVVMTRDVYHTVLGSQMDADRIDAQFDLMRRMSLWGYAAVPLVIWLRVALVALTVQMVGLLFMTEIPFRQVFRAASWAFVGILYGTALRVGWLARLGPEGITEATLTTVPDSLASLLLEPEQVGSLAHVFMSMLNLGELVWAGVLVLCLTRTKRVGTMAAVGLVVGTWMLLALLQGGISAYLTGVA